jgi:hypothetical protein
MNVLNLANLKSRDKFSQISRCIEKDHAWNRQYQSQWNASTNESGPREFRLCLKRLTEMEGVRESSDGISKSACFNPHDLCEDDMKWKSHWSIMRFTILTPDMGWAVISSKIRLIYARQAWQLRSHMSNLWIENKTLRILAFSDAHKWGGKARLRLNGTSSAGTERFDILCQCHEKQLKNEPNYQHSSPQSSSGSTLKPPQSRSDWRE